MGDHDMTLKEGVLQGAAGGSVEDRWLAGGALLLGMLLTVALVLFSRQNYLLFHGVVELVTVAISWSIFFLSWNSRRFMDNHYFLVIGIGALFVGGIDLLHALAFKGMGVFPGYGSNLATQLWVAGRYLQALTLNLAILFLHRRAMVTSLFIGYGAVVTLIVAAVFLEKGFPVCYQEGIGLTPFKIGSEYLIIGIFLAAGLLLYRHRDTFDGSVLVWLMASLFLTVCAELSFTRYLNVHAPANLIGHLLRLWSTYCLYRAIIVTGLVKPYDLLFRNLAASEASLKRLNESLEEMVAERTAQLSSANELLESELAHRRAVEEALRLTQFAIDRSADAAYWLGPDGRILYVNDAACRALGHPRKSLLAFSVQDVDGVFSAEDWSRHWQELKQAGTLTFETIHVTKAGVSFPVEVCANFLRFGGREYNCAFVRDISARKQAEEEIRRLKNYLANIVDSMPSMLMGLDASERVTFWNREAESLTGVSAGDAVGRPVEELLPDSAPWIRSVFSEEGESRPIIREKLSLMKDGVLHYYDFMAYPLGSNYREGAVIRIEDVTERTRLQELMVQTEKMMTVGGLAAGMAHEINNPLGIILQAAQIIERRISPQIPANRLAAEQTGIDLELLGNYFEQRQIAGFLRNIEAAAQRASRIITNMLQFSRQSTSARQAAHLSELVDRAVELAASDYDLKKNYDFKSIQMVREFDPELPVVPVVLVEIEQVVLNLLKNAAHAMVDNPPERPPQITLRLKREAGYAVIEVEDNGSGMTEQVRRRVFEPFFTTKEPGCGTGLGLSVSYMIITGNHGGELTVESIPGHGTCFSIKLPLMQELSHG